MRATLLSVDGNAKKLVLNYQHDKTKKLFDRWFHVVFKGWRVPIVHMILPQMSKNYLTQ
jgi:hypothetical protein